MTTNELIVLLMFIGCVAILLILLFLELIQIDPGEILP